MTPPPAKTYIGDGAYVAFDGYYIVLTTEDGLSVQNRVCLEPSVWDALKRWCAQLDKFKEEYLKGQNESEEKESEGQVNYGGSDEAIES